MVKRARAATRWRRARSRGGYSLVILAMIVTTMSVLAAAALPAIEQMIRRNKEEELIFRGFQYAEAIRVFQRRYSRYPVRLDELIETKPRCIRQLWKDPMTADGSWELVTVNRRPPGTSAVPPPPHPELSPPPNGQAPPRPDPQGQPDDAQQQEEPPSPPQENQPILGVVSKSHKESIKTLFGQNHYNDWRFTADVLPGPSVGPGGRVFRTANATWIGRPFRQNLAQPGAAAPGKGLPGMPVTPGAPKPPKTPAPGKMNG
jgi:type II secretory pathway pseudopilin PulG